MDSPGEPRRGGRRREGSLARLKSEDAWMEGWRKGGMEPGREWPQCQGELGLRDSDGWRVPGLGGEGLRGLSLLGLLFFKDG
eukprot:406060-Hanusia_phi.AAC.1